MSHIWSLIIVPFLIALNAFFVAGEYAVVAATPERIESMRRRGRSRAAGALESLVGAPSDAIGTIQVCITMTNLLLGWLGEPGMTALLELAFGPLVQRWPGATRAVSIGLSFIIVTLLTVVFSELLPKALTLRYVTTAATLTAVPILLLQNVLRPLVWLMTGLANVVTIPLGLGRVDEMERERITPDEIRLLAARAGDEGALTARERSLVLNSLTIGRRQAREVMVPRVRVAYLDLTWPMDRNRDVLNSMLFSRLPLCDGGMDRVVGLVRTKEFLAAYHASGNSSVLRLIAGRAVFAPSLITLDRLLGLMKEQKTQFVFLVDEHGGVEGIVTLQDVVDELIGEFSESATAQSTRDESNVKIPVADSTRARNNDSVPPS